LLSVDQLTLSANPNSQQPLLEPLSFTLNPDQAVALVGPSGCGKTTLLRTIAGLIDPLSGCVTLHNQSPKEIGWPSFRQKVGLVPQRPVLWDTTVCENLLRPLSFSSIKHTYLPKDVQAMLAAVDLEDKLNEPATQLSEGERQRICLVRALLAKPDFMLLDEPTSALDEASIQTVESLLNKHMADTPGLGVLIVTHDRAFADRFCSRIIDLSDYLLQSQAVTDA